MSITPLEGCPIILKILLYKLILDVKFQASGGGVVEVFALQGCYAASDCSDRRFGTAEG